MIDGDRLRMIQVSCLFKKPDRGKSRFLPMVKQGVFDQVGDRICIPGKVEKEKQGLLDKESGIGGCRKGWLRLAVVGAILFSKTDERK